MITMSKEAMAKLTPAQLERLKMISQRNDEMQVTVDFSLPADYTAVFVGGIYGGIDGNGVMST